MKEETAMDRRFSPEKYGMTYCPVCKGAGKSPNGAGGAVCKMCGGFGLIKKQDENNCDKQRVHS
jgi:DnaJ-class molecular chaperone